VFQFLTAKSAAERMHELARFLDFWYGPRRPEYGETPEALARLPLPYPLRRFHSIAGRRPSPEPESLRFFYIGAGGHHLLPLKSMHQQLDGKLRFFMEYQGEWDGLTLARGNDPPVWIEGYWDDDDPDEDEDDETPPKSKQACDSLSKFLITHCLMTTLYEDYNSPCEDSRDNSPLIDFFKKNRKQAIRIWDADCCDCPNYEGVFYLFQSCILVHQVKSHYRFGALRPSGVRMMVAHLKQ